MSPPRLLVLSLSLLLLAACSTSAPAPRAVDEAAPRSEAASASPSAPAPPAPVEIAVSASPQAPPSTPSTASTAPPAPPAPAGEQPLYWADLKVPMHPLYASPEKAEEHIGTLRRGFHFPVFEAAEGPGCGDAWLRVGPGGWVCGQHVERLEGEPTPPPTEDLPFRYVNVFRDVEIHTGPGRQFKTGKLRKRKSILSVLGEEGRWVHAYPDEWLDKRELIPRPDRTSSLEGLRLGEEAGALEPFVLVRYNHVMAWPEPAKTDGDRRRMGKKSRVPVGRFSRHPVLGQWPEGDLDRADWLQLPEGWVEHWRLGVVRPQPRPRQIEATERWILVDLSEQTLVAYEGDAPVYATLVSTGRDEDDKRTPPGIWRITHKLRSGRMSGGTGESYHYVSDVPWIQYFNEGIALHGVYWHNALGWPQSNGCVNLTPHDARWLFEWTEATLPAGWYSMLTSAARPGTWVVVQQ